MCRFPEHTKFLVHKYLSIELVRRIFAFSCRKIKNTEKISWANQSFISSTNKYIQLYTWMYPVWKINIRRSNMTMRKRMSFSFSPIQNVWANSFNMSDNKDRYYFFTYWRRSFVDSRNNDLGIHKLRILFRIEIIFSIEKINDQVPLSFSNAFFIGILLEFSALGHESIERTIKITLNYSSVWYHSDFWSTLSWVSW